MKHLFGFPAALLLLLPPLLLAAAETPWKETARRFTAPPPCEITVKGSFTGEDPKRLVDGVMSSKDHCRFTPLKGAEVRLVFPKDGGIDDLAVVRSGWKSWAIPEKIAVRLDDDPPFSVELSSPRVDPAGNPPAQFDRIILPRRAARITVTVLETSGYSPDGTLELGCTAVDPAIDFHAENVPAEASGIELRLFAAAPNPAVDAVAAVDFHRVRTGYRTRLAPLPAGESIRRVEFSRLVNPEEPEDRLNPRRIFGFSLEGGKDLQLLGWRWLTDEAGTPSAWERLPELSFRPQTDGWRTGIPADGFGRFGWINDNGLLIGRLTNGNTFQYMTIGRDGKPSDYAFRFRCGPDAELAWERMNVRWSSVVDEQFHVPSVFEEQELPAIAPELERRGKTPSRLIYSIHAPGFLVDSDAPYFWMQFRELPQPPRLTYPGPDGKLRRHELNREWNAADLGEGWLLLSAYPDQPPLLLAFEHRPAAVSADARNLIIRFPKEMGKIGVGTPAGYRRETEAPEQLAERARTLARILRAYPLDCRMSFKADETRVEIRERFSHLLWENDWKEESLPVAPVSPLLAFARDHHYGVRFAPGLADGGILTKFGPYAWYPGSESRYSLPLPPMEHTLYLAPQPPGELVSKVAANLIPPRDTGYMHKSGLRSWWFRSPVSLALPLFAPADREIFLREWREVLEENLRPHVWNLRKEPYTGGVYPYCFAWKHRQTGTLGDINSGIGAALYGPYSYAAASGDWELVRQHWPLLRGAMRYFLLAHDWCQMQTAAQEESGSSNIDMDGIGYLGAVAFLKMAEQLGEEDDLAAARLLTARLAVSASMRWLGADLLTPDVPATQRRFVTVGFNESGGFSVRGPANIQDPDRLVGELALSLAWVGEYPELYQLHLWGCGEAFWRDFADRFLETVSPDWRRDYPGNRNGHSANLCAFLYLRGMLGASQQELTAEVEKLPVLTSPSPMTVHFNAPFYAMLFGMEFPVRLERWGGAAPLTARFDREKRRAELAFRSETPFRLELKLSELPTAVSVNGAPQPRPEKTGPFALKLPAGESRIELDFNTKGR
mgnify:CR=1 FL=1